MGTSAGLNQGYKIIRFPPGKKPLIKLLCDGSEIISYDNKIGKEVFSKAKIIATFPTRNRTSTACYHSFGMTENYFVFVEQPFFLSSAKFLMTNFQQKTLKSAMKWHPNERVSDY